MPVIGGWTPFKVVLSKDAKNVFEKAVKGLMGVKYVPIAFATQVVKGTNYCFICNAKAVYPGAKNYGAVVYVFKPLRGNPHITHINRI